MEQTPIAVVLTDTHLSEQNLDVNISLFKQTIEFCLDNDIKTIIHNGDVFHSRKAQPQILLTAFEQILDEVLVARIHMIVVTGNHDKTDYDSPKSFLSPFKHHPALTLIETYNIIKFGYTNVAFLSYFNDNVYNEHLKQLVDQIDSRDEYKDSEIMLFTHIGVAGARMNNGVAIESDVTPKQFKRFNTVKIGHYHDGQSFANIHYIGASLQHNFGERPNKGLQVLYNDHSMELIQLESPQYIKYEIDVNSLTQKDLDDLREEKENGDNFLRIVLVGQEQEVKAYNVQALKMIGVDVQMKVPDIDITELQSTIEPFTNQSLIDQFGLFCEERELDQEQGNQYFSKIVQNV